MRSKTRSRLIYDGYLCGPTLNGKLHLGNFKTFFKSIHHYYTQRKGSNCRLIVNITDIGDVIYDRAKTNERGPLLQCYINAEVRKFVRYLRLLGLKPWRLKLIRTSSSLKDISTLIKILARNWANTNKKLILDETGVYPNPESKVAYLWRNNDYVSKMYKLPLIDLVEHVSLKKEDLDELKPTRSRAFSLSGIPGWHCECAAIIANRINSQHMWHYGGADLRNIHHYNEEIILHELKPSLKITWCRTAVLCVKDEKMSKSLNNIISLEDCSNRIVRTTVKQVLESCSASKINQIDPNSFNRDSGIKDRPINLRQRRHKNLKRLALSRFQLRRRGDFVNADIIRARCSSYTFRDLKNQSQVYHEGT